MIQIVEKLIETAPVWAMFWLSWMKMRAAQNQAQAKTIQAGQEGKEAAAPQASRERAWRKAVWKRTGLDFSLYVLSGLWLVGSPWLAPAVTPLFIGGLFMAAFTGLVSWINVLDGLRRLREEWRG